MQCYSSGVPGIRTCLLLALLASPSFAQNPLSPGDNSELTRVQTIDDPSAFITTANESMMETATRYLESAISSHEEVEDSSRQSLRDVVETELQAYGNAVALALIEMKGDGVVTFDELTGKLQELREEHLNTIQEEINAEFTGDRPPPDYVASQGFVDYTRKLLKYTLLERNPPIVWLTLLVCILAGLLVAGVIALISRGLAHAISTEKNQVLSVLTGSIRGPLYLVSILVGIAIGLKWVWLPIVVTEMVSTFVRLLFVVGVFWFFWNLAGAIATVVGWAARRTKSPMDDQLVDFCRRAARLVVLVIAVLFITEVVFDVDFRAMIAGIGIAGLAVTLASQDTLKNLIGFFTIYADVPFRLGDYVTYKSYFGPIEVIGFRSTTLRTLAGYRITIPNAELVKETIENVSARRSIRMKFFVDIVYGTPPDKIREAVNIISDIISKYKGISDDDSPHVFFQEFGESSFRIYAHYHYEPPRYWEAQEDGTEVKCEIVRRLTAADIDFAFPTRTLYIEDKQALPDGEEDPRHTSGPAKPNDVQAKDVSLSGEDIDEDLEPHDDEGGEGGDDQ